MEGDGCKGALRTSPPVVRIELPALARCRSVEHCQLIAPHRRRALVHCSRASVILQARRGEAHLRLGGGSGEAHSGSRNPDGVRADLPHDLAQYVVEAATGYDTGFWGLVAKGATFKSTGRRRTKQGRELIATHRSELARAEELANVHLASWRARQRSPVTTALDDALNKWQSLSAQERLVFDWPTPIGEIEPDGSRFAVRGRPLELFRHRGRTVRPRSARLMCVGRTLRRSAASCPLGLEATRSVPTPQWRRGRSARQRLRVVHVRAQRRRR